MRVTTASPSRSLWKPASTRILDLWVLLSTCEFGSKICLAEDLLVQDFWRERSTELTEWTGKPGKNWNQCTCLVSVQRWLHVACFPYLLQRPTAKELLKHKFITRYTKKTSFLMELIDRFKRWKSEGHGEDSSSGDSDTYVHALHGGVPCYTLHALG